LPAGETNKAQHIGNKDYLRGSRAARASGRSPVVRAIRELLGREGDAIAEKQDKHFYYVRSQ
jgi:hypothetical protein